MVSYTNGLRVNTNGENNSYYFFSFIVACAICDGGVTGIAIGIQTGQSKELWLHFHHVQEIFLFSQMSTRALKRTKCPV